MSCWRRVFAVAGVCLVSATPTFSQEKKPAAPAAQASQPAGAGNQKIDKAAAYYHFSLGHIYSELAAQFGTRGDYLNKAIDNYREALKQDSEATFLADELADLYIQGNRLREGVTEFESAVKQNPNDLNARRILGRIYTRLISDQQSRIREDMVKKAVEQYQKIAEANPEDFDTYLMLGRLYKVSQNSPESEKAYKRALEIEPENEDALAGLAMVYSDLGDHKKSTDMLNRISQKSPSARTLVQLAQEYEQMREYKLAAQTYKRAIDTNPPNATDLKRAMAQDLLLADDFDESLKIYRELVAEEDNDVLSWLRISQIHRQLRQFDKAREASEKAKAIDGNNLDVRYNDVSLLEAEGKTNEAIKLLKEILDSTAKRTYNPAEKAARVNLLERLGVLYRNAEKTPEAVAAFRQIGELDPELGSRASAQVVETLRIGKEYVKAEQEAEAAFSKFPTDRMITLVRASVLADVGKAEQAIAATKKLLNGKDDRETYITLAQLYEKAKRYDDMGKALGEADKLSTSKEDKINTAFMRGAMYEKQKKFDLAEGEFRKVLADDPDNIAALNYLGYMLADRNTRLQEAYDLIQKAVDKDPHNGAYLDSLGWVYYRLNKFEDAEKYLRLAVEKVSRDATVHDHLGDVYSKLNNLKDAIRHWELALREWETGAPADKDQTEYAKVQKKLESAKAKVSRTR